MAPNGSVQSPSGDPISDSDNAHRYLDQQFRQLYKWCLDHSARLRELTDRMADMRVEIAKLKVRSGVWGFAAGCLPVLAALLFVLLKSLGNGK